MTRLLLWQSRMAIWFLRFFQQSMPRRKRSFIICFGNIFHFWPLLGDWNQVLVSSDKKGGRRINRKLAGKF